MISYLNSLVTLLLLLTFCCSTGWFITAVVLKLQTSQIYWIERYIVLFLIGSAVISWLSFLFILFGIDIRILFLILTLVTIYQAVNLPFQKKFNNSKIKNVLPIVVNIIMIGLIVWIVSDIFILSNMVSDGLNFWGFKAKVLFDGNEIVAQFFKNPTLIWAHLDYPLYLPVLEMLIYKIYGSVLEPAVLALVPGFYLLTGLFIFVFLQRFISRFHAFLLLVIFLFIPHLREIAVLSYADFSLAIFYLVSAGYYFLYLKEGKPVYRNLSLLVASNLFWVKKEGLILYLIYLFGLLIFRSKAWRKTSILLLVFIISVPLLLWNIFITINGIPARDFVEPTLDFFLSHLNRLVEIPTYTRRLMKFTPDWGLFWPILGILTILRIRSFSDLSRRYLLYAVIVPLVIYPFLFFFSAWIPYYEHVRTALDRLILQVFPLAFVLFALLLSGERSSVTYQKT